MNILKAITRKITANKKQFDQLTALAEKDHAYHFHVLLGTSIPIKIIKC